MFYNYKNKKMISLDKVVSIEMVESSRWYYLKIKYKSNIIEDTPATMDAKEVEEVYKELLNILNEKKN